MVEAVELAFLASVKVALLELLLDLAYLRSCCMAIDRTL